MTRYRIVTKPGNLGGVFYAVQCTLFGFTWTTLAEYGTLDFAQSHMDELIAKRNTEKTFKSEVIRSE